MNLAETSDLLAFIARCDNRRVDDSTVVAWHSIVGEIPFEDALAAVREHFRTREKYLMPVHVVHGADAIDRDRRRQARELREAAERLELESAPRTDRSKEIAAAIRDMLPAGNPDALRRAEWLDSDKRRDRLNEANANPDYDPTVAIAAAVVDPDFNPAYQVARCGQTSVHAPHVVDHGPDQPRNCPGFDADAATRAATLAAEKGS